MAIKPIDLLTNMGQISEVARAEQNRQTQMTEEQKFMAEQQLKSAKIKDEQVDKTEKSEGKKIKEEEHGFSSGHGQKHHHEDAEIEKKNEHKPEHLEDDRLGRIIDIKK